MLFPRIEHPVLGTLRRGWGKWSGSAANPSFSKRLDLVLACARGEESVLLDITANLILHIERFKMDVAPTLYEDYHLYKKFDLEAGSLTEADYVDYPAVNSPIDIWGVIEPYRLTVRPHVDQYLGNADFSADVKWPNPHFFQIFLKLTRFSWEHVHTELVG